MQPPWPVKIQMWIRGVYRNLSNEGGGGAEPVELNDIDTKSKVDHVRFKSSLYNLIFEYNPDNSF